MGYMRITLLFSLALSTALVLSSGCVRNQVDKPVFGVPDHDTLTSKYEKPVTQVVAATREVLNRNGKMVVDNIVNNTFEAKVNQRDVSIKVADLDGKITVVTIQVRGPMGSDIDLAAELKTQIALQLMKEQKQ